MIGVTIALLLATSAAGALPPLDGAFINVEQKNLAQAVTDLANRNYGIIVVQYSSNKYHQEATRLKELDAIFKAADEMAKKKKDKKIVDVYVGLYYDETWNRAWQTGTTALRPFLTKNKRTIADIDARYGDHPRFKGWYVAHEIGNAKGPDAATAADFFERIASACRAYDNKRGKKRLVLVSAYFNPHNKHLQPETFATRLSTIQNRAKFDRVLLQDGVGARLLDPQQLPKIVTPFYSHIESALGKGALWGVVELFCCPKVVSDCQCAQEPSGRGTDDRIVKQKAAIVKHVSRVVAFEFNDIAEKPNSCGTTYCNVAAPN